MDQPVPAARKGRKYEQVMDGAQKVFLAQGYEGANVDDIAREAGVSKATLYSYFADKRLLFLEVARVECKRQADSAVALIAIDMPPQQALTIAARALVEYFTSDFGQKVYRTFLAEAERFPDMAREFYCSGTHLVKHHLVEYMRKSVAKGALAIDDIDLAADQFAELCKADLCQKLLFGVIPKATEAEKRRVVDGAVSVFMARYGV